MSQKQINDSTVLVKMAEAFPQLDLTSDRSRLRDPYASVVKGVDVIHAGRFAIEGGRANLGMTSKPGGIVSADDSAKQGISTIAFKCVTIQANSTIDDGAYDDAGDVLGDKLLINSIAFSAADEGRVIILYNNAGTQTPFAVMDVIKTYVDTSHLLLTNGVGQDIADVHYRLYDDKGIIVIDDSNGGDMDPQYNTLYTRIVRTPNYFSEYGGWDSECVDGYVTINGDARRSDAKACRVVAVATSINANDTLLCFPARAEVVPSKITVTYRKEHDKRGVIASDGRNVWLAQNGAFAKYLDMGSGVTGIWKPCQISDQLMLLSNPKYPSRILRLEDGVITTTSGNESLAGLIPPCKPINVETQGDDDANTNKSWVASADTTGGLMDTASSYRVMVRAVNLVDGAESIFVPVYDAADNDDQDIAIGGSGDTGQLRVWTNKYLGSLVPTSAATPVCEPSPYHSRWSHIEIWRTTNAGALYYLERRVEIDAMPNEGETTSTDLTAPLLAVTANGTQTCEASDAVLPGMGPTMTVTDLVSGWPPPICQQAVSLAGITICGGAADESPVMPTAYMYGNVVIDATYTTGTQKVGNEEVLKWLASHYYYKLMDGDEFVCTQADGNGVVGVYSIASQDVSNGAILLDSDIGSTCTTVNGYIRRAITLSDWPVIDDDETIWYSRTDANAPESFSYSRTLTLSRTGDTFRAMVNVSQYVLVVMAEAVHLIYLSGSSLAVRTVASTGRGTPWADSVVAYGSIACWATPYGPVMMSASSDANSEGNFASIQPLDGANNAMRAWFFEAYENGENIDAGFDTLNRAVRFRRHIDTNTFQVAQVSMETGRWTLLDDDNGVAYARSTYAGSTALEAARLYSVTVEGQILAVNDYGTSGRYDGSTVTGTLSGYAVTTTSITKAGVFNTAMAGDVIRFYSTATPSLDEVARVIRTATANAITFDTVTGLTAVATTTFAIGAVRMDVRFPPIASGDQNVMTLRGLTVIATPGPRAGTGDWPDPPDDVVTVRSYQDYGDDPADTNLNEIPVFDSDDVGYVSEDRVSAVDAEGRAIEIGILCVTPKTDLRIEAVNARVEGDEDIIVDSSTTT